jgi:hypothetical protein
MNAALEAVPAAAMPSGLPLAVTIAVAATAIVAIGMIMFDLRRSARLNRVSGAIAALSAVGVIAAALIAGSLFTQQPSATAEVTPDTTVLYNPDDLTGLQLPTLGE